MDGGQYADYRRQPIEKRADQVAELKGAGRQSLGSIDQIAAFPFVYNCLKASKRIKLLHLTG